MSKSFTVFLKVGHILAVKRRPKRFIFKGQIKVAHDPIRDQLQRLYEPIYIRLYCLMFIDVSGQSVLTGNQLFVHKSSRICITMLLWLIYCLVSSSDVNLLLNHQSFSGLNNEPARLHNLVTFVPYNVRKIKSVPLGIWYTNLPGNILHVRLKYCISRLDCYDALYLPSSNCWLFITDNGSLQGNQWKFTTLHGSLIRR